MENKKVKTGGTSLPWIWRVVIRFRLVVAVFADVCFHDRARTAVMVLALWALCSDGYAELAGVGIRPWHFETLPLFVPDGLLCALGLFWGVNVLLLSSPRDFRYVTWRIWDTTSNSGLLLSYALCWALFLGAILMLGAGILSYLP